MEMYANLLNQKIKEFFRAVDDFKSGTVPKTKEPRLRRFTVIEGRVYIEQHLNSIVFRIDDEPCYSSWPKYIADKVLQISEHKPRNILRVIRRVEAAAEYFRKRAEGRRRMAEEILRQQKKFLETLEAEAALVSLSR
ncbi:MAG: hypothetical protein QXO44_02835 [Thermoplasmatales archaeon]